MASVMVCDSCGTSINPSTRVWMQWPSGVDAGYSIELCLACADAALKTPKVKTAKEAFVKRRDEANAKMQAAQTS